MNRQANGVVGRSVLSRCQNAHPQPSPASSPPGYRLPGRSISNSCCTSWPAKKIRFEKALRSSLKNLNICLESEISRACLGAKHRSGLAHIPRAPVRQLWFFRAESTVRTFRFQTMQTQDISWSPALSLEFTVKVYGLDVRPRHLVFPKYWRNYVEQAADFG